MISSEVVIIYPEYIYIHIYIYETKLHVHSGNQLNPATSPQNPHDSGDSKPNWLGFCQQYPFFVHQKGDLTKKTLDLTQRKWALNMIQPFNKEFKQQKWYGNSGCMMVFFLGSCHAWKFAHIAWG